MNSLTNIRNNKAMYNNTQVTFIKTSDELYFYYNLFNIRFDCIAIGDALDFNGTTYVKKSTRTAYVQNVGIDGFIFLTMTCVTYV